MSEMPRVKVVVKRSQWLHGEGSDTSSLLRTHDNKMCCLGFALDALGVPRTRLEDHCNPSDISQTPGVERFLEADGNRRGFDNRTTKSMMGANDTEEADSYDEATREDIITCLGAKLGLDYEFVD